MNRLLFILIIALSMITPIVHADSWRSIRAYQLGAGGTKASHKSEQAIKRDHGLLTERFSGERYLFGLYLNGGYSAYVSPNVSLKDQKGENIGGGLLFEFEKRKFWMHTGIGINYQQINIHFANDSMTIIGVPDSWTNRHDNFVYDLTYRVEDRQDKIIDVSLQIPLIFGIRYKGLYWGAGPKIWLSIAGNISTKANLSTIADYDRYIGTFEEMDNHGWRRQVAVSSKNTWSRTMIDILASTEIGYEWSSAETRIGNGMYRNRNVHEWRVRIGAYIDFGLLDICPNKKLPLIDVPTDYRYDFIKVKINSPFVTQNFSDTWARELSFGIKFTVLYGFKAKEKCILCYPPELESDMIQNRQIKK